MGETLTEGDAWVGSFSAVRIAAEMSQSGMLIQQNEYSAARRLSQARTYDPTRRCDAYNARRCATSGQRKGSFPRSPTLLRYRMMTR